MTIPTNEDRQFVARVRTAYLQDSDGLQVDLGRAAAAGRRRQRRRRGLKLSAGAGLAAITLSVAVVHGTPDPGGQAHLEATLEPRGHHPAASGADIPDVVLPHAGPCAGTQLAVPAEVSGLSINAPVLIPKSNLASLANLSELWACASGGYVAVFANGLEVVALPGYEGVSNATKWPDYVKSNGYGSVGRVHGAPGAIEEPDADHTGLAQVIINGWLIQVLGDSKTSAADLVNVADTL